jgi:hypothetical protein
MSCLLCLGQSKACFAKFQKLPIYAETTHHHLGKEEKATLLILLLTIILVLREAACFVLWVHEKKENIISCCLGFA